MNLSKNQLIDFIKPKSISIPLVRIGGDKDGAYLVPSCIKKSTHCFSPGVNNVKQFEDDLAKKYGIKSFLCDFSSNELLFESPLILDLQSFRKLWLDIYRIPNSISLAEWISSENCSNISSLILQMDIERAEYRNLLTTRSITLSQFEVIIVEVHCFSLIASIGTVRFSFLSFLASFWLKFLRRLLSQLSFFSPISSLINFIALRLEPYLILHLFSHLSKTHTVIHAHPNNCRGQKLDTDSGLNFPHVIEMTLLRNDIYNDNKASSRLTFPHPLDLESNVEDKPVIKLNKLWSD